uniref:Uncharacterized protein n=1 Tax=Arcella intermedia TaxID=1963864 RepID=A0A6B2LYC8_9EUKA
MVVSLESRKVKCTTTIRISSMDMGKVRY